MLPVIPSDGYLCTGCLFVVWPIYTLKNGEIRLRSLAFRRAD